MGGQLERMPEELQGKKVLVADDDPPILRIVQMVLSRVGLEVITAADGEEAFQKAVREKPDAILLDIRMPKMDGLELCSKLKATEATAEIPVGFLTAEKDLGSYKLAQELGSLLYITKPFKPERLVDTIGALLTARRKY
jgi:DNA-binding response OmpR family regulator